MTDISLTDTYEFDIDNGDFKSGDAVGQHIRLLFDTTKGDWTQNPLTGIGAIKWLNGRLDARFEREIQLQIEADGQTGLTVEVHGKEIFISKK